MESSGRLPAQYLQIAEAINEYWVVIRYTKAALLQDKQVDYYLDQIVSSYQIEESRGITAKKEIVSESIRRAFKPWMVPDFLDIGSERGFRF